jgi:hypothetical protein
VFFFLEKRSPRFISWKQSKFSKAVQFGSISRTVSNLAYKKIRSKQICFTTKANRLPVPISESQGVYHWFLLRAYLRTCVENPRCSLWFRHEQQPDDHLQPCWLRSTTRRRHHHWTGYLRVEEKVAFERESHSLQPCRTTPTES